MGEAGVDGAVAIGAPSGPILCVGTGAVGASSGGEAASVRAPAEAGRRLAGTVLAPGGVAGRRLQRAAGATVGAAGRGALEG